MSQANKDTFSVGTFNTWGVPRSAPFVKERYQALCQHIERSSLDLLHLQEVWFYPLLGIVQRQLPTYPYLAYKRGLFGPQAGLVTISRFPLTQIEFMHFPPTGVPPKKRWWERATEPFKQKGALLSFLPQWSLMTCNCHLLANMADDWSKASQYYHAHTYAIERLATLVNEQAQQEKKVLIMGDFNIPKWSDFYQQFVHLSQAIDLFEQDESPTYHQEFWLEPQRLDYVFLRLKEAAQIKVLQKGFLFGEKVRLSNGESQYLSDHIGLMAVLHFENG
ncbi:MAG TPA: endonuclease/exonuclease/phosphatase family protein [Ktedonobacteraceae bacterium]|nr:endonuclease/exonuclease/phosphatase family protein [Ktedonobacteraceae bacterium]